MILSFSSEAIPLLLCKLLLNVLDLNQIHLATAEDISCGLQYWARLFKAQTWEELQMLASEYKDFEDITDTMQQALADKKTRMECEARERYERDRISLYNSGRREGRLEGRLEARKDAIVKAVKMSKNYNVTQEATIKQLIEQFELSQEEATELVSLHWD